MDRNFLVFSNLANMRIELVGQQAHNSIGQRIETKCTEQGNTGGMKQAQDITPKNDPIKAGVNLNIWDELIHKRVVYGYFLFRVNGLGEPPL